MPQANPYPLRVDKLLMGKLRVIASGNGRSVNKEIEMLIKQAVQAYEKENGPIEIQVDEDEY